MAKQPIKRPTRLLASMASHALSWMAVGSVVLIGAALTHPSRDGLIAIGLAGLIVSAAAAIIWAVSATLGDLIEYPAPRRFSLRLLLLVTTLIALTLGVIVCVTK